MSPKPSWSVTSVWSVTSSIFTLERSTGGGGSITTALRIASRLRSLCHINSVPAASGRKIICGIAGIAPMMARMHPTGSQVLG